MNTESTDRREGSSSPWVRIIKPLAALLTVILGASLALFTYMFTIAVYRAPFEPGHDWQMVGAELPFLCLLVSASLAMLAALFLFLRVGRLVPAAALLSSVVLFGSTYHAIDVGEHIRASAFKDLTVKMRPVISAIERYQEETGAAPSTLEELVPEYLRELPTGIPNFDLLGDANAYEGNEWALVALVSSGGLNWDLMVFLPAQNYSEFHGFEPVAEWGYFHE